MALMRVEKEYPFELTVTDPDTGAATIVQGVTRGFRKDSVFDNSDYSDDWALGAERAPVRLLYTDISLRAIGGYIERLRRPYGE